MNSYSGNDALTIEISRFGKQYGYLTTTVPPWFQTEDRNLLAEISDDIALAIENIQNRARLHRTEARFRELVTHMSEGIVVYQPIEDGNDFVITDINHSGCLITNSKRETVVGKTVRDVFPWAVTTGLLDLFASVHKDGKHRELLETRYENQSPSIWVDHHVYQLSTGEVIAVFKDVSDRVSTRTNLERSVEEKENLIRELYHRTNNNMQVICSLLNLKQRTIKDEQLSQVCNDVVNRIQTMALVHQRLYHSQNLSRIALGDYLQDVTQLIVDAYDSGGRVTVETRMDAVEVVFDIAAPLGLVLAELLANSLLHAYPEQPGVVSIELHENDDHTVTLSVSDDGVGIPVEFEKGKRGAIGLETTRALVEGQLHGSLIRRSGNGTQWEITISLDLYGERV